MIVRLSSGDEALIDDDDAELVLRTSWWIDRNRHAVSERLGKRVAMHRLVMNAGPGTIVDHKNHNTLDNRKANLRFCTRSQNLANQRLVRGGSSRFKGVCLVPNHTKRKWSAYITLNKKRKSLGYYETEEEAAAAYDAAAIELFGEFAYLNFHREVAA